MTDFFRPIQSTTANQTASGNLSVTTSTGNILIVGCGAIRLVNTHATALAYVNFGNKNVAAVAATDLIIRANSEIIIEIPEGCDYMAHIGSASLTLNYTLGN